MCAAPHWRLQLLVRRLQFLVGGFQLFSGDAEGLVELLQLTLAMLQGIDQRLEPLLLQALGFVRAQRCHRGVAVVAAQGLKLTIR